jgi:fatty-acyl-CoA synthase
VPAPGYGLTEAAPLAAMMPADEVRAHPTAAGRTPLFCTARFVAPDLEDVAHGEVGELLLSGPNVTPGYLGDAEANARAFTEDGWLRTGDAARMDASGMIELLGRVADALVVNGRSIHPAPIEAELTRRLGLATCALVQPREGATVTLFVVPQQGAGLDVSCVHAVCKALLGRDVAPTVRRMSRLPTNANGKLLRASLRAVA